MPKRNSILPTLFSVAVFIVMEIAALNMLRHNAALQDIWIARGVHRVMGAVWGRTEAVRFYFSLRKENERLADENFELQEALRRYREAEKPVPTLEDGGDGFSYLKAEIVKMSRNKQHNYLIINKGHDDGVSDQCGIVSAGGIIGIVDAVGKHHAYALSFLNSGVSISSRLGREGPVGPLVWDGVRSNGATLKEIPLQYKYAPGDTVFTSGFSAIFPPDIPLGIAGGSKVINGAVNEISVTLFQDYSAVRYVSVVRNNNRAGMEALAP